MRLRLLLLTVLFARFAAAQVAETTRRAPGVAVSGVVHDSIARAPLAGATVQLVAADSLARFGSTALSDASGRFTFSDVPEGRYTLGFFHPMLDSLGLEPTLRAVRVDGRRPVRADLAIPSPARIRAAVCGQRGSADSGGAMVIGVVRDARDRAPVVGATVTGEWLELSFNADGLTRRVPRLVATTGPTGWFAICNVPSAGTMAVIANRGADSTDLIELQVPAERFLRRELYLGPARPVVTGDPTRRADSLSPLRRRLHAGDGRVSGTVVTVDARPLAGAQVNITDGPQTRTNERGEWTLADAPTGTRMLEVRAVGYYPERRPVAVLPNAPPERVVLATFKSVLDTVKITASHFRVRDLAGFQQRRRSGLGRYLTADDIVKQKAVVTADIFRRVPGIRIEFDTSGADRRILVRGNGPEWCPAAIYVNGTHLGRVTAEELEDFAHPSEIAGIEIYAGLGAPLQYQALTFLQTRAADSLGTVQEGMQRCGSILIWTKR